MDPRRAAGSPKAGVALTRDQQRRLDDLPVDGKVLVGRLVLVEQPAACSRRRIP
jgi:hypothetical protein